MTVFIITLGVRMSFPLGDRNTRVLLQLLGGLCYFTILALPARRISILFAISYLRSLPANGRPARGLERRDCFSTPIDPEGSERFVHRHSHPTAEESHPSLLSPPGWLPIRRIMPPDHRRPRYWSPRSP